MPNPKTRRAVLGEDSQPDDIPAWAVDGENSDNLPAAIVTEVLDGEPIQGGPALQNLIEWIGEKLAENDEDSMAGIESIVREMMTAQSPEDVLKERLPVSGANFRDRPMMLHGFRVHESEFGEGEGAPAFVSMDVTILATGERKVINCGGWVVLAQIKMLDDFGEWPQRVMVAGKTNKKGRTPLRLVLDQA